MSDSVEFNKTERSLLLFLETCAVENGGLIRQDKINKAEFAIAEKWGEQGFIQFGRIPFAEVSDDRIIPETCWFILSEAAWMKAHQLRIERANRGSKVKQYAAN